MGVAAFQHIGAVVDHVGDADVEDLVRGGGAHARDEIAEDAVARGNQKPLGHAAGRHLLIIFLINYRHFAGPVFTIH